MPTKTLPDYNGFFILQVQLQWYWAPGTPGQHLEHQGNTWNNQDTAATNPEQNTCYRKVMCEPWWFEHNSQQFHRQLNIAHIPSTNQALHNSIKLISKQELNLVPGLKKTLGKIILTLKLPRKEEPNPFPADWISQENRSGNCNAVIYFWPAQPCEKAAAVFLKQTSTFTSKRSLHKISDEKLFWKISYIN